MLVTQEGWFAQFDGKGVEFPLFLQTTLADLSQYHRAILLNNLTKVDLGSLLGSVAVDLIASSPNPEERLLGLYRGAVRLDGELKIITALRNVRHRNVSALLAVECGRD